MRKKCGRFFRGFLRKKVLQDLPHDPTEEGSAGSSPTRGLGRALGAGRGRGISEDAHEADVPRRRRPTALARRQRVRLREDVTERPEDVPQLHEDVSHVSDATPEMTGAVDAVQTERVATDGSLGSPAADEGFPSGPRDPSILTDFAEHEQPDLKLVSHGRKVDKIGRPAPEIKGLIAGTGLSPLIRCSVITTDPGLISAFVERWHRETSMFHLPVGELTITVDDMASLLHVPITGALHTFEPLVTSDAIGLLTELLEVHHEEATFETRQAGGPHVQLGWLRDLYESQCRARRWVVAAHTYLLHLVGCTIFANKSSTHVHVVHLEAFRDLAQAGGFAWGAVALVHMYEHLNDASQCWIYEHFPTVHTSFVHDAYDEESPRACRWLTGKAHMTGIKGASYRRRLDALTVTDVCWMPYGEHQGVKGFDLISSYTGQLRWGQIVVYIRPERVLRQFGYLQTVPPPPVCDSLTGDDIDDRWLHFSDHLVPSGELCVVPGQVAPDYMEWFFRILHPFVMWTEETATPRHPPPPHHEEFVEPPIPEVSVATDLPTHSVFTAKDVRGWLRI
ncbi:protein MAIN-LIKE 1-like [Glycine soja]|uniref:protein MAIN-LIKE 1-like n=1 Tax=Glycine soja TaxID=3848 RepID=UPI00103FF3ED|nr:protein MAIN-LIKE 1-like [Glycine soja]